MRDSFQAIHAAHEIVGRLEGSCQPGNRVHPFS